AVGIAAAGHLRGVDQRAGRGEGDVDDEGETRIAGGGDGRRAQAGQGVGGRGAGPVGRVGAAQRNRAVGHAEPGRQRVGDGELADRGDVAGVADCDGVGAGAAGGEAGRGRGLVHRQVHAVHSEVRAGAVVGGVDVAEAVGGGERDGGGVDHRGVAGRVVGDRAGHGEGQGAAGQHRIAAGDGEVAGAGGRRAGRAGAGGAGPVHAR
ncbi:putative epstein-Barr nuclear antigen 1, partial [Catenibacterium mitsuokai DSM 15897]